MSDMKRGDDAELDTTETEFDAMWNEGVPVGVLSRDHKVVTTYGTLYIHYGVGVASSAIRRAGTHVTTSTRLPEAVHQP